MRKINTFIRHYLHIEPDGLSDEAWAQKYNEVIWLLDYQDKKFKAMMGN